MKVECEVTCFNWVCRSLLWIRALKNMSWLFVCSTTDFHSVRASGNGVKLINSGESAANCGLCQDFYQIEVVVGSKTFCGNIFSGYAIICFTYILVSFFGIRVLAWFLQILPFFAEKQITWGRQQFLTENVAKEVSYFIAL